jgi:hypothetical protein
MKTLLKFVSKCVMLIEPLIFAELKSGESPFQQNEDPEFIEKVQVLLIIYYNMGVTQIKVGNLKYSKVVFDHGWKMARKLLGQGSYFEQKFFMKINESFSKNKSKKGKKSTHLSYIQDDSKHFYSRQKASRPNSSYVVSQKEFEDQVEDIMVNEELNYQKYRSQKNTEKLEKQLSQSNQSTKIIAKSHKRKIFTSKEGEDSKHRINESRSSQRSLHSDAKIDEELLKKAIEEAKREVEQKYEQLNKTQQSIIGI